ncbi:MAG: hypothetical protein JNL80_05315, partial [Phycisphaerae bacterium]|nr:hypothetical protein [Phycisphaerae bacterium]
KSRWTKDLATDMDFVSVDVSYDENSNPLTTEENIYDAGFDVKYAIDGMDRVTDADEGTLSSGSITSRTRRQQWTLTQTGNWQNEQLDLNGDGDETDTDEHDDTRTHNAVNELTARDTDSDSTDDYTLTHDAAGNLTDDGETYVYEYDAWYRLRKIKDRGTSAVLSEHQYYGNGFRAGEHYDADQDSDVDSNDPWYWFAYDERWRIVGTFVGSDSSPKERFLHHTAGGNGYGSSSYIDQVVLRERDANTGWHLSSDGTLEERLYYCQNWRHDVVALVTSAGALKERVRYSSYGVPFGIPLGDCDSDGDVDSADSTILLAAWGTSSAKCDLDLNGTIDATDQSVQLGNSGLATGSGTLSSLHSRLGYAGYCAETSDASLWHVRHRMLESLAGSWITRDRDPSSNEQNSYSYISSHPIRSTDFLGLSEFFVYSGKTRNYKGNCGNAGCFADIWLLFEESDENAWEIVAKIHNSIWGRCCNTAQSVDDLTFYELWTPLKPLASGMNFIGEHSFKTPQLSKADFGGTSREVEEVRLIPASFASDAQALSMSFCGMTLAPVTNPTSLLEPSTWGSYAARAAYPHTLRVDFGSCCNCSIVDLFQNPCAGTNSASCHPGPQPKCTAPGTPGAGGGGTNAGRG